MAPALLAFLISAEPGLAGPFDRSPRGYSAAVNRILTQVEADFRFQLETCSRAFRVKCRFSSQRVSALVEGSLIPPRIERIILTAHLLRNKPGADPLAMVADTVLALGATMVTFDPELPPSWRVALLSDLMVSVLDTGKSEGQGIEGHYFLSFDPAANGLLSIAITAITPAGKARARDPGELASGRPPLTRPTTSLRSSCELMSG
jgi:hypothetical protein